jgi:peptidyl-prolyl cis-trans isomerase SurA
MVAVSVAVAFFTPATAQERASTVAVVNEDIITTIDLAQRTSLILFATGLPQTPEIAARYEPQVLKTMIDETLQRQAAKEAGIKPSAREKKAILDNMERENRLPPGGLDAFLASKGVEISALERQVDASLSWTRLIERKFASQAAIGEDEIDDALTRIQENLGKPRNLVSEIFLVVEEPRQEEQVRQAALRIIQQLRGGASFDALARAFSQNAAAVNGGDLGWVVQGQLPEKIERELAQMRPGQIAGPLRTTDGYHIVALRDRQLAGGAAPNQITVDLRQIIVPLSAQASEGEVQGALAVAEQIGRNISNCAALEVASLPGGARASNIGRVNIGDLAAPLQQPLMGLQANQISQPLRGPNGLMLLMVCERESKEIGLPSRDQVKERLFREKLDRLARRYLRDLRRAAFLDIRR